MKVEGRGFGPGGNVTIQGDLTVHGDADITAHMEVDGHVKSENLDVGGHFRSGPVTSKRMRVGGHTEIDGTLEAEAVDVGGHFTVSGAVKLASLDVGGHAKVGGGTIHGDVKVMGHFESTKKLEYGNLRALGRVQLPGGSAGERISVHGSANFEGDTSCHDMKIAGAAKVAGNCTADTVEVLGKLDIGGSLGVSKELRILGNASVEDQLKCEKLTLGGKLEAERALVNDHAELAGDMQTATGLKAKSIIVGRSSKVTGALVGEEVAIGEKIDVDFGPWGYMFSGKWFGVGQMTRVGDVYARSVKIGAYSSAKHLFAEVVEMDEGSMADRVTYTSELKLPGKYHFNEPPMKVTTLPNPPL
jgi:cytoskeletal protein CcmA (bactofilin family)